MSCIKSHHINLFKFLIQNSFYSDHIREWWYSAWLYSQFCNLILSGHLRFFPYLLYLSYFFPAYFAMGSIN